MRDVAVEDLENIAVQFEYFSNRTMSWSEF